MKIKMNNRMEVKNEDYLKFCGKGDLKAVQELFSSLDRQDIESIRDSHKARFTNLFN
jgi:hypothetical protein